MGLRRRVMDSVGVLPLWRAADCAVVADAGGGSSTVTVVSHKRGCHDIGKLLREIDLVSAVS